MNADATLRVFGVPALETTAVGAASLRTKKQLALLVYLALDGRSGVSRDTLVELLWPDVEAGRGQHSLSQALSAIRSALGPGSVESRRGRVTLAVRLPTEIDRITDTDRDLPDLTAPLANLDGVGGIGLAHWLDAARHRLTETARAALLDGFVSARQRGETSRTYTLADRLVTLDPLNATAVQALAERALLAGSPGEATRILRAYLERVEARPTVAEESAVAAMRRVYARIQDGGRIGTVATRNPSIEPFVGRRAELEQLEALWAHSRESGLRAGLLVGPAGIGKSRLLRRFAMALEARGHPTVVVTCQEIGRTVPYAVLAAVIDALGAEPSVAGTDPEWLAEASRITPGLKARYPGLPTPDPAAADAIRLRIAEAVYRMLEAVAEEAAVVLAIDDVQHLDAASAEVLHVVARRLRHQPALLLAAYRTDQTEGTTDPATPQTILRWDATIALRGLPCEDATQLASVLSEPLAGRATYGRIRAEAVTLADGNPYFLEMLIADWREHGDASLAATQRPNSSTVAKWRPPDALRTAFARHYDHLAPEARRLLDLLAVAARGLAPAEMGGLLHLTPAEVDRWLLEVFERGVVRLETETVSFKNELHRAFVYYAMADTQRQYLHRKLAEWSEARADGTDSSVWLEAGHHYRRAGDNTRAATAYRAGAEAALACGAPAEAEAAARECLALDAGDERALIALCEALNQQGNYGATLAEITQRNILLGTALSCLRAEAAVRDGTGPLAQRTAYAADAMRTSLSVDVVPTRLRMLQAVAELAADTGDPERLTQVRKQVKSARRQSRDELTIAHADLTLGFCHLATFDFAGAWPYLKKASFSFEARHHANVVKALNGLSICYDALGEFTRAIDSLRRALHYADEFHNATDAANILNNLGVFLTALGQCDDARRCMKQAGLRLKRTGDTRFRTSIVVGEAQISIIEGDLKSALHHAIHAVMEARRIRLPGHLAEARYCLADVFLAKQQPERALRFIRKANAALQPHGYSASQAFQTHLERLVEYERWVTAQVPPPREVLPHDSRGMRIATFTELTAWREWRLESVGDPMRSRPNTRDLIRTLGLHGVEGKMRAIGMFPSGPLEPVEAPARAQPPVRLDPRKSRITSRESCIMDSPPTSN